MNGYIQATSILKWAVFFMYSIILQYTFRIMPDGISLPLVDIINIALGVIYVLYSLGSKAKD